MNEKEEKEQKVKKEKVKYIKEHISTKGETHITKTGCGKMYTTLNEDPEEDELCQVMSRLGKPGTCARSFLEGLAELITLALAGGIDLELIISKLIGIRCPMPKTSDSKEVLSCCDGLGKCLDLYLKNKKDKEKEEDIKNAKK